MRLEVLSSHEYSCQLLSSSSVAFEEQHDLQGEFYNFFPKGSVKYKRHESVENLSKKFKKYIAFMDKLSILRAVLEKCGNPHKLQPPQSCGKFHTFIICVFPITGEFPRDPVVNIRNIKQSYSSQSLVLIAIKTIITRLSLNEWIFESKFLEMNGTCLVWTLSWPSPQYCNICWRTIN